MAFLTKLLKCVNVPTHVHNNYLTESQVRTIVNNTLSTGAANQKYIGMPDYVNAELIEVESFNYKTSPIWKIKAPGYLYYNSRHAYADRDYKFCLAASVNSLRSAANFKAANDAMYLSHIYCSCTTMIEIPIPVVPGTTTYFRLARQETQSYSSLYFIPIVGLTTLLGGFGPIEQVEYTEVSLCSDDAHAAYMFADVKSKIFAGDWKDNFPSLNLCHKLRETIHNFISFFTVGEMEVCHG